VFLDPNNLAGAGIKDILDTVAVDHLALDRRVIRQILARPREEVIAGALEFFGQDGWQSIGIDLIFLFRHYKSPEALEVFTAILRQDPEEVPEELIEAIVDHGPAALEPMLALYNEIDDEYASADVVFILAALRVPDKRVLQILCDHLEFDMSQGAIAIGLHGDPAARPALLAMLESEPEDPDLKHALSQLGRPPDVPPPAFDWLAEYEEELVPVLDSLTLQEREAMLGLSAADYREAAVASLKLEDLPDHILTRIIELAQSDPEISVRTRAWHSLADSSEDERVQKAARAIVFDEAAPVDERLGALFCLAEDSGEAPIRALMYRFAEDPATRARALNAMWNSLDKSFAPEFLKYVDDADLSVRRASLFGIGYCGLRGETVRLRKLFNHEELREDALFAYALCAPSDLSASRMRSLLNKIEQEAQGLTEDEEHMVMVALNQRMMLSGKDPVFDFSLADDDGDEQ